MKWQQEGWEERRWGLDQCLCWCVLLWRGVNKIMPLYRESLWIISRYHGFESVSGWAVVEWRICDWMDSNWRRIWFWWTVMLLFWFFRIEEWLKNGETWTILFHRGWGWFALQSESNGVFYYYAVTAIQFWMVVQVLLPGTAATIVIISCSWMVVVLPIWWRRGGWSWWWWWWQQTNK